MNTQKSDRQSILLYWSVGCFLKTSEKTKIGFVEEQILHSSSEKSVISLHFVCQGIFSAKYCITVLEYPPYSLNVALCYLLSFLNVKLDLKGTQFKNAKAIKVKSVEIFKFILENYQHCFVQWTIYLNTAFQTLPRSLRWKR